MHKVWLLLFLFFSGVCISSCSIGPSDAEIKQMRVQYDKKLTSRCLEYGFKEGSPEFKYCKASERKSDNLEFDARMAFIKARNAEYGASVSCANRGGSYAWGAGYCSK